MYLFLFRILALIQFKRLKIVLVGEPTLKNRVQEPESPLKVKKRKNRKSSKSWTHYPPSGFRKKFRFSKLYII